MFDEKAKAKALAIVRVFETGKALGNYGAVAVLTDGAGLSVGAYQFTHKSGSLASVIDCFEALGGNVPAVVQGARADLASGRNIPKRSSDAALKNALRELGNDPVWQQAQRQIAFEKYLDPAVEACEGSNFQHPLSLAVIYDSKNQGAYDHVRDMDMQNPEHEEAWITAYCYDRKSFLLSSSKAVVRQSVYRPNFFIAQIKAGNWALDLPVTVQGCRITDEMLFPSPVVSEPPVASTPESEPEAPERTNSAELSPGSQASPSDIPTGQDAPTQPVPNVNEDPNDLVPAAPSLWDRITGYQSKLDAAASIKNSLNPFTPSLSPISGHSWVSAVGAKILGAFTVLIGLYRGHETEVNIGAVIFIAGLAYLAIAKFHALERLKALCGHSVDQSQQQKVVVNA